MFALLGTSALHSAFLFAFTLPNLFRRLLGEGALSSAFVPLFSERYHASKDKGFVFLAQTFSWLFLILTSLTLLFWLLLGLGNLAEGLPQRWHQALILSMALFPYVILVCLAAILGGALNVLGVFGIPALSAIWLNGAMIAGCCLSWLFDFSHFRIVCVVSGAVLIGGLIQMGVPFKILHQKGFKLPWSCPYNADIKALKCLFLPGVFGAAIAQVNIVVSRCLAFSIDDSAVSVLYLANRLMELPLGIFTISVTTVTFPQLAFYVAQRNGPQMGSTYARGLTLILAITIPAACGLIFLGEPILGMLFRWGQFSSQDLRNTLPVVILFAMGLPFYSLTTFATRAFHALKDTRTPVRVGGWVFGLNLTVSLLAMRWAGVSGLALASLISTVCQSLWLQCLLQRQEPHCVVSSLKPLVAKIVASALPMGLLGWLGWLLIHSSLGASRLSYLLACGTLIPFCVFVYLFLLNCFGVKDLWSFLCNKLKGQGV